MERGGEASQAFGMAVPPIAGGWNLENARQGETAQTARNVVESTPYVPKGKGLGDSHTRAGREGPGLIPSGSLLDSYGSTTSRISHLFFRWWWWLVIHYRGPLLLVVFLSCHYF